MQGWNKTCGEITKYFVAEDELWSLANYFFSSSCRKTSTYQYGLLKSIMDSLFCSNKSIRGIEISFETIFTKFSENYWNLVTKYHLRQMRYNGNSDKSRLEMIIDDVVAKNRVISELEFSSINDFDKKKIISEVTSSCKKNAIGALYSNFDGVLFGFDLKDNGIWLNPIAYEFILKHKFELEKLNYYAWAKFMERVNNDNVLLRVLDKLEDSTPKRKDLSYYRNILQTEFEENTCFYCGKKLTDKIEVDHIIPWRLVRDDKLWNFVLACKTCNAKKNDKIPEKIKLYEVVKRNEEFLEHSSDIVTVDFSGYSSDLMIRLWNYARIGGYKEFQYNNM